MAVPVVSVSIKYEDDVVAVRHTSRQIARVLGFDAQDQARISAAASEIARNAYRYAGGGKLDFLIEGSTPPQLLIMRIADNGPGITALDAILEGRYASGAPIGMGIMGARRLMDQFEIQSEPGRGTTVWLKKVFPRNAPFVTMEGIAAIGRQLAAEKPTDAFAELQLQNRELLRALEELRKRQEELRRVNNELEDTNRGVVALYAELDERADHLRRADELKSKFLSNMSHEFRSPLNSILALSRLLLDEVDGTLNGEQRQQVGYIRKAASDLYELVNDLLDLAKVEAGKVELKPMRFYISNLFGALRGMLRPLLLNQSVALVFEPAEDLPEIYSDEGKISQILRNLLSNALKFTERGEVRVTAELQGDQFVFSVADTGIGIAAEDQERIFEDFAQVDHPIQHRVRGTGLGLPLSRKLARLLGGELRVSSELGRGSTFTLAVPALAVQAEGASEGAVALAVDSRRPVLVVENSSEMLLVYSRWLGPEFQVVQARNTWDAEQKIAAAKPSAVILDILLDGEDAWDLLASLKRAPDTADIPVIVISATNDPAKAFHLGADSCLVKPVYREAVLNELRRLTSHARRPRRVLIIEDEEKDRYLIKRALRDCGLEVGDADTGSAGLTKAIEDAPDVIVLDLGMPDMDGFQVLRALRADARTRDVPVIVNTSRALTPKQHEELSQRVSAILSKEQYADEGGLEQLRQAVSAATSPGAAVG